MVEENIDSICAKALGMHPDQVGAMRNEWERVPMATVVRCLIGIKLGAMVKERETKLRSCKPEELLKIQGELNALQLAIDTVNGRLV